MEQPLSSYGAQKTSTGDQRRAAWEKEPTTPMTNDMHTLRGPIGRIASVPPTKKTTIADRDVGYDLGPQIWFWDMARSFELERLPELKREIYQFCYTYRSVCLDPLYHALM